MKVYTFSGETPTEALQKAQNACGKDAVVINTRMIRKKTFSQSGLYEVVVAVEDDKVVKVEKPILEKEQLEDLKNSVSSINEIDKLSLDNKQTTSLKDLQKLQKSLESVNKRVLELQELLLAKEIQKEIIIAPEFMSIYHKLKQAGVLQKDLNEIFGESMKYMPAYMRTSDETINRYFRVLLKKLIPIRKETPLTKQKVIMFVGPTGVGKTTTLAKLAARYSILEYNYKVGIITLDTYRIGAVEQLYQYAKMMKLSIEDVIGIEDFKNAFNRYINMDIILIDTVGSSQYDREKLRKLKSFIDESDLKIDVNLVVSANSKYDDLVDVVKSFEFFNLDTLIVTKFDETKSFGNIFSLVKNTKLPLSYFSVGQEVPDDLRVANSDFFISCLLDGFKYER